MARINSNHKLSEYPSSYEELRALSKYLKDEANFVSLFIEEKMEGLKTSFKVLCSMSKDPIKLQSGLAEWLPNFAIMNYVFQIKYLELVYGVCCPNQVAESENSLLYLDKDTLPTAPYFELWQRRILLSDTTTNFTYTKRCVAYAEAWNQKLPGFPEQKNLVSSYSILYNFNINLYINFP